MYGYIYLTTNLVNNKQYIGKHKANKFEPERYIGSGRILKEALKKYGKENFKCKLLEECETKEQLNLQEKYWISYYNAVENENFYNLADGGDGGDLSEYIDYSKSNLKTGEDNYNYGKHYTWINNGIDERKLYDNELLPENFTYGRLYAVSDSLRKHLSEISVGRSPSNKGKPMSEEQKLKDSLSRKGKCLGDDNPSRKSEVREKLCRKYKCPYCNNYISTKSCVHRHINKNHKLILESATTIESIDWEKYSIE